MKKRLLFLMLSACFLCAASLRYLAQDKAAGGRPGRVEITDEGNILLSGERKADGENVYKELKEGTVQAAPLQDELEWEEDGYAYQCLNETEQKVYQEIYGILKSFGEDVEISLTDPEQISRLFQCVLNDHPEIFYVQGYTYTSYSQGPEIVRITLSGTYTMTPQEAGQCQEGIDAYVSECLAGLDPYGSDYEKVKYIYEYLIHHTQYNLEAKDNQNICSVFLYGESVCQGYAKAMQYLLEKAGVFCTLVIGSVSGGEGHAWNLVRMDGNYYYVDTTWGDASYQREEGLQDTWTRSFPDINYDYLGVTTEQLLRTHILNNVVELPLCESMDCNYYVREGTYLTECAEETLKQLFDAKFWNNGGYITLKASTEEVYVKLRQLLVEEQRIFEFIRQADGTVAYSDNDAQYSLSFWVWPEEGQTDGQ